VQCSISRGIYNSINYWVRKGVSDSSLKELVKNLVDYATIRVIKNFF